MRTDEARDRALEGVLRQSLTVPAADASGRCVDAETLAAWTSGALLATEAAAVEVHLAACERCQAMLATLAQTEPPAALPASEPLWRRWHVQWLVPLATAAIAIAVWLAVPGEMTAPPQSVDRVERPQPSDVPPPARQEPPASAVSAGAQAVREPAAGATTLADASKNAAQPAHSAAFFAKKSAPTLAKEKDNAAVAESKPSASADALEQRADAGQRARADENRREMAVSVPTQPRTAAVGTPPTPPLPASPAPSPAPAAPLPSSPTAAAPSASAPATAAVAALERAGGVVESVQAKVTALAFASPGNESRWRIAGARVEYSSAGGDWQLTDVPPNTPLTTGSSPSARVCWLAGRAGIVYLTTNGPRFTRIPFPDTADLASIRAADEKTATVTTITGRTYSTSDAGKSWR